MENRENAFMLPWRGKLNLSILVVTLLGLLDAAYLTYEHYTGLKTLPCPVGGNGTSSCVQVQSSQWSFLLGVPVALLGLICYAILLGSLFLKGERGRALAFLLSFGGFGYSLYLTYREAFTIHAYCEYCLGSAFALTLLALLTGIRFFRTYDEDIEDYLEAELRGSDLDEMAALADDVDPAEVLEAEKAELAKDATAENVGHDRWESEGGSSS